MYTKIIFIKHHTVTKIQRIRPYETKSHTSNHYIHFVQKGSKGIKKKEWKKKLAL